MFLKRETRLGAAAVLVAVLSLSSAAPAGALGMGESWDWSARIVPRVLDWLGLGWAGGPKCEHGSQIDPDGCPKDRSAAKADHGSQIDPNGNH